MVVARVISTVAPRSVGTDILGVYLVFGTLINLQ
jgi:hypothetical protein